MITLELSAAQRHVAAIALSHWPLFDHPDSRNIDAHVELAHRMATPGFRPIECTLSPVERQVLLRVLRSYDRSQFRGTDPESGATFESIAADLIAALESDS